MSAKDLLLVRLSIIFGLAALLICSFKAGKVLGVVRHMKATINCSLQSTPHPVTHTSTADSNVQDALERPLLVLLIFNVVFIAINLFLALELLIEAKLLQDSASTQQSSSIGCCIVLVAGRDAKVGQLMRRCSCNDDISPQCSIGTLDDAALVGESNNQAIFAVVELVLVLTDHFSAGMIVRLALSSPPPRNLEALEVGCILQHLHKRHVSKHGSECGSLHRSLAQKWQKHNSFHSSNISKPSMEAGKAVGSLVFCIFAKLSYVPSVAVTKSNHLVSNPKLKIC